MGDCLPRSHGQRAHLWHTRRSVLLTRSRDLVLVMSSNAAGCGVGGGWQIAPGLSPSLPMFRHTVGCHLRSACGSWGRRRTFPAPHPDSHQSQRAFDYLGNSLTHDPRNAKAILAAGSIIQDNQARARDMRGAPCRRAPRATNGFSVRLNVKHASPISHVLGCLPRPAPRDPHLVRVAARGSRVGRTWTSRSSSTASPPSTHPTRRSSGTTLACASLAKPSELSVAPLYSAASSSEPFATPSVSVTRLLLHTAWRSNKENTACPHTLPGPLNRLPSTSPARALARARACCSFVSRRGSRARSSDDGRHRDSRGAPLRVNLILQGTSRRWRA